MSRDTTRRRFLATYGRDSGRRRAGDLPAFAQRPDGPNLILVIVDSLRADAVYDRAIATPNIDVLVASGLHFTSAYPEAMPTVPARNSILGGRRTFPFRHWHDYPRPARLAGLGAAASRRRRRSRRCCAGPATGPPT